MDDFADFAEGDTDKVREHILQRTHSAYLADFAVGDKDQVRKNTFYTKP